MDPFDVMIAALSIGALGYLYFAYYYFFSNGALMHRGFFR